MKETMTPAEMKGWRAALGITQAEAAEMLDMSHRQITGYEIGEYPIPITVIYSCHWLRAVALAESEKPIKTCPVGKMNMLKTMVAAALLLASTAATAQTPDQLQRELRELQEKQLLDDRRHNEEDARFMDRAIEIGRWLESQNPRRNQLMSDPPNPYSR